MADEAGAGLLEAPGADGGEEQQQQQEGQEQEQQPEIDPKTGKPVEKAPDGRNQPDALKKHLAALKADQATATLAKTITDRVGKTFGYEQAFPTVREAKEAKALIESFGGKDSISAAVESHASMQRVDALLEAGDPAVLDEIFKQAPEGMIKLVGPILEKAAQLNPQAFERAITPHAVALLAQQGLPGWINSLVDVYDALADRLAAATPDTAGAKRLLEALKGTLGRGVQWYTGLQAGAKPKAADPDRAKLDADRATFENTQSAAAVKATFDTTTSYAGTKIDAALAPEVKRLGLGQKAVEALRQDVWAEIQRVRNADSVYKSGLATKFDGKKPKPEAVAYLNGYTDRLMKDAVSSVVATRYGDVKVAPKLNPTAAKGPAKGGGAAAAALEGSTRVSGPPAAKDIDYDDKRTDTFAGRAVLKSTKKLVNWR